MTAVAPVRIGFVGCGWVTDGFHLPAVARVDAVRATAVADRDPARRDEVGDRWRIDRRHEDAVALATDPEVDAVAVCTPTETHLDIAAAALAAGKHVLIEKPLATDPDAIGAFTARAAKARARDRIVLVGSTLRWHREVRIARDRVRAGEIGPVEAVRGVLSTDYLLRRRPPGWRASRERGGGVLYEVAAHHFDLLRFLLDTEIESVAATVRPVDGVDAAAAMTVRMASGAIASLLFSERTICRNEFELLGPGGSVEFSCYTGPGAVTRRPGDWAGSIMDLARVAPGVVRAGIGRAVGRRGGSYHGAFDAMWRHFAACARGKAEPESTVADGRAVVEACRAAARSAEGGGQRERASGG